MDQKTSGQLPPLIRGHLERVARIQASSTASSSQIPGPLPSLQIADAPVVVTPAPVVAEPVAFRSRQQLEVLRLPLQTVFTILGLISVPFIAYVLSSKAGFNLVKVTYPALAVVTAGGTIAIWLSARNAQWSKPIAAVLTRNKTAYWVALQIVPITGFELWRDRGAPGSLYRDIPLFALVWAFLWMAGTFRMDSDDSEGPGGPGGRGKPIGRQRPSEAEAIDGEKHPSHEGLSLAAA